MNGLVNRHQNKRKKSAAKSASRPKFWLTLLDRTTLAAGIIGPIMVAPQIYKIFSTHTAAGVSAISWFAFGLLDLPFILYGVVHKDKAIIVTYTLFCIANFIVAIGAVIYR